MSERPTDPTHDQAHTVLVGADSYEAPAIAERTVIDTPLIGGGSAPG